MILNIPIFFRLPWMMARKICSKPSDSLGCKESSKLKCTMWLVPHVRRDVIRCEFFDG